MFESLSERLGSAFDKITGRGALSESDVKTAMREVRRALLEADVALEVAKDFIDRVTEKAVGRWSAVAHDAFPLSAKDRTRCSNARIKVLAISGCSSSASSKS